MLILWLQDGIPSHFIWFSALLSGSLLFYPESHQREAAFPHFQSQAARWYWQNAHPHSPGHDTEGLLSRSRSVPHPSGKDLAKCTSLGHLFSPASADIDLKSILTIHDRIKTAMSDTTAAMVTFLLISYQNTIDHL